MPKAIGNDLALMGSRITRDVEIQGITANVPTAGSASASSASHDYQNGSQEGEIESCM